VDNQANEPQSGWDALKPS